MQAQGGDAGLIRARQSVALAVAARALELESAPVIPLSAAWRFVAVLGLHDQTQLLEDSDRLSGAVVVARGIGPRAGRSRPLASARIVLRVVQRT